MVSEIYSAPRVTEAARRHPRLGSVPGLALHLTSTDEHGQPWNFDIPAMRVKAEKMLEQQRPALLIGSPMCTPLSNRQDVNKPRRDPEVVRREKDAGRMHLARCCKLYARQMSMGGISYMNTPI